MFDKTPSNLLWNSYYNHANEPVHFVLSFSTSSVCLGIHRSGRDIFVRMHIIIKWKELWAMKMLVRCQHGMC